MYENDVRIAGVVVAGLLILRVNLRNEICALLQFGLDLLEHGVLYEFPQRDAELHLRHAEYAFSVVGDASRFYPSVGELTVELVDGQSHGDSGRCGSRDLNIIYCV